MSWLYRANSPGSIVWNGMPDGPACMPGSHAGLDWACMRVWGMGEFNSFLCNGHYAIFDHMRAIGLLAR